MTVFRYVFDKDVFLWFQNLQDPHDIAVSLTGDAIYVAEITPGKGAKLQKYDVMAEESNNLDSL